MALIIAESFDYYNSGTDMYQSGLWDATSSPQTTNSTNTKWGFGNSLNTYSGTGFLGKSIGSNESTFYISMQFLQTAAVSGTTNGTGITFYDGATAQCTVNWRNGGTIVVRTATASRAVDEAGLFDADTAGNMFISATFPVINLANGDSLEITAKLVVQ